jgi:hypothetical protein
MPACGFSLCREDIAGHQGNVQVHSDRTRPVGTAVERPSYDVAKPVLLWGTWGTFAHFLLFRY